MFTNIMPEREWQGRIVLRRNDEAGRHRGQALPVSQ
jgi:hypothetical protein